MVATHVEINQYTTFLEKKGQKSYDHLSRHIKKYDLTKSNKLSDKNTYPRISIKKKPTLILYLMVKKLNVLSLM